MTPRLIVQLRALVMPETTTYISALRTGQLDYIGAAGGATQLRSDEAATEWYVMHPDYR